MRKCYINTYIQYYVIVNNRVCKVKSSLGTNTFQYRRWVWIATFGVIVKKLIQFTSEATGTGFSVDGNS